MKKRTVALLLALVLLIGVGSAGTVAYLYQETQEVENTFEIGDVNIDLEESTGDKYPFVPGDTITKDPIVQVWDSVDSYVFIKVVITNNTATDGTTTIDPVLTWEIADGWEVYGTPETTFPQNGTYYFCRSQDATGEANATEDTAVTYPIIADNKVYVSDDVTKDMVTGLENNPPKLTFQAAIVQKDNIESLDAAFEASGLGN